MADFVDFKYTPQSPEPLSGPSFVDQTEQAINEIGNAFYGDLGDIRTIAERADENATNAINTANDALSTANDAASAVQNAQNTANEALETANNVAQDASDALARANEAYDTALNADSKADNAVNTANAAQESSNSAQAAADAAQSTADSAQTSADSAQSSANTAIALASFVVTDELIEAGTYITTNRLYITNTASTGLPVSVPCYFASFIDAIDPDDATTTDYQTVTTQWAWTASDPKPWIRAGTIDNTDPDNPLINWSTEWQQLGEGGGGDMPTADEIFTAVTVRNPNINLDNVFSVSGNFYAATNAIASLPVTELGFLEVRTDIERSQTLQRYTDVTGTVWQRTTTSKPDNMDGVTTYDVTMTSGAATVTEQMRVSVADGVMTMTSVQDTRFNIRAESDAPSCTGNLSFFAPASEGFDFDANGLTLTIAPAIGTGNSMTVSLAADGTETIASGVAEVSDQSRVNYLSGEILEGGDNSQASFWLVGSWLNSTGDIVWTDWVVTSSGSSSVIDQTARDTATEALTTANSAASDASTALTTASNANTTAENAASAAVTAQTTADNAAIAASTAQTTADSKAPLVHYSSTPTATGKTLLGGNQVYQVTVDFGVLPNATSKSVAHGVASRTRWVKFDFVAETSSGIAIELPYAGAYNDGQYNVQFTVDQTSITVTTTNNMSSYSGICTIEYAV